MVICGWISRYTFNDGKFSTVLGMPIPLAATFTANIEGLNLRNGSIALISLRLCIG
jgi:hypothetical protein